jgi:hypothetical protein
MHLLPSLPPHSAFPFPSCPPLGCSTCPLLNPLLILLPVIPGILSLSSPRMLYLSSAESSISPFTCHSRIFFLSFPKSSACLLIESPACSLIVSTTSPPLDPLLVLPWILYVSSPGSSTRSFLDPLRVLP